jgi:hypothetical protein
LLATLGVVFEIFVVKEKLFASGKNKLCAAVAAFKDSVRKLHGRLPKEGKYTEIGRESIDFAGPVSLSSFVSPQQGARAAATLAAIARLTHQRRDDEYVITMCLCGARLFHEGNARGRPGPAVDFWHLSFLAGRRSGAY